MAELGSFNKIEPIYWFWKNDLEIEFNHFQVAWDVSACKNSDSRRKVDGKNG